MTKFCIDLEDMMLPDAIAAVVEAWLDAHSEEAKPKQNRSSYQNGESIQRRKSIGSTEWEDGWIFLRYMGETKVGICQSNKYNFELGMPQFLIDGNNPMHMFHINSDSGCSMIMPHNIKRPGQLPLPSKSTRKKNRSPY